MTADIKRLSEKKIPIVKIDKKLEQFKNKVLFPKKLETANRILENTGLPVLN